MRRLLICVMLLLSAMARADQGQGWRANQIGKGFWCKDVSEFSALSGSTNGYTWDDDPTTRIYYTQAQSVIHVAVAGPDVLDLTTNAVIIPLVGVPLQFGATGSLSGEVFIVRDPVFHDLQIISASGGGNLDYVGNLTNPLATTATSGFFTTTSMPGIPTGAVVGMSGLNGQWAWTFDSTDEQLYARPDPSLGIPWQLIAQYTGGHGTGCVQTDNAGVQTVVACGGGGSVTAVSATAPLDITGGASPTPNVVIRGSIVSGSTSTAAINLGTSVVNAMLACSTASSTCTPTAVTVAGGLTYNTGTGTETLGSFGCGSNTFVSSSSTAGLACTQPLFANLGGSLACSQLPALMGGVTSAGGTCATTVASVPCGALPAFGGDLISAGGTCSVQVQAIEETSGPARLSINAIPDLGSGGVSILNRPGATGTVVGSTLASLLVGTTVPCGSLPTYAGGNVASTGGTCALNITSGTLKSSLAYYDASVNPILGGGFLATSSSSSTLSSTDIPYPLGIAAVNGRLRINILANNIVTSLGTGVITWAVFLNGSNSGLSTTALTTVAAGTQLDTGLYAALGSTALTDGWSVKVTSTGTFVSGSITFTAVVVLGY